MLVIELKTISQLSSPTDTANEVSKARLHEYVFIKIHIVSNKNATIALCLHIVFVPGGGGGGVMTHHDHEYLPPEFLKSYPVSE